MHLSQLLERAARHGRDLPAITCGEVTRTWGQAAERCARVASALTGLGVMQGDRVAYLSHNSADYFESFFSCPWQGSIIVPLNARHALPELIEIAEDCTPCALIVDEGFLEMGREIAAGAPSIRHLIVTGPAQAEAGVHSLEELVAAAEPMAPLQGSADDVVSLFYTSGTTGAPKGVMLTNANFFVNSLGAIALYRTNEIMRSFLPGPLFHVATSYRVFSATMTTSHTVLVPRFEVRSVFEAIEKHKVETTSLVPTMVAMMIEHPDFDSFDLSSLKIIGYGASPITEPVLRRAMEKFPNAEFRQGYGMTEAAPLVTVLGWEEHQAVDTAPHRLRSAGKPMNYLELKITDADDQELPSGEIGEITIRGPNIMKGYWNKRQETEKVLRGGWLYTGDAGYLDEEGYLYIVDRVKDMIVTGGENVYSTEVENALQKHPAVAQCAIIGVPHEKWVEAVHAVVVLRAGVQAQAEELIAFCHDHIAGYKCPRGISFRSEPLPLSGSNKVLKTELRAAYLATLESDLQ